MVLWALFALAIPIIIHLFNFRKFKKVYFSNVSLLREIKIDTQSTNRLKHLLILLCRILAVLLLVIAFAQPFLVNSSKNIKQGSAAISVFVDNSFSMNAENRNGNLLDAAKKAAKEIAMAYKPSDKFQLLTNDFEAKHQRLVSRDEFLDLLENIATTTVSKDLGQIYSRQADALSQANQNIKKCYLLSDFQKSMYDFSALKTDSSISTVLVPFKANDITNIYIDSVWFENPNHQLNKQEQLNVRIRAAGNNNQTFENIPLKIYVNNEQKSIASFNIETNNTATVQLNYTNKSTGPMQCRIELQDHPITFDDTFFITYNVVENIQLNCINGNKNNKYLDNLFGNDSFINYTKTNIGTIDYSSFSKYNSIILNEVGGITSGLSQELQKFLLAGGTTIIIPSNTSDIESYNRFFEVNKVNAFDKWDTSKIKVDKINLQHIIYNDIFEKEKLRNTNLDLPIVRGSFGLTSSSRQIAEPLLQLQNGQYFLFSAKIGRGRLFVCTQPLSEEYSNFVKHALFVPTFYKIAITSIVQSPLYYKIGSDENIKLPQAPKNNDFVYHIENKKYKFDIIPATKIIDDIVFIKLHSQLKIAGNYMVSTNNNNYSTALAFNYGKQESELVFINQSQLEKNIDESNLQNFSVLSNNGKSMTQLVKENNAGKSLWKYALMLSLLFILFEVLLLSNLFDSIFRKVKA